MQNNSTYFGIGLSPAANVKAENDGKSDNGLVACKTCLTDRARSFLFSNFEITPALRNKNPQYVEKCLKINSSVGKNYSG